MITAALTAGAINAALATLLAAAVLAATWAWRNPFVARGMWLAVLLRFLAPPLVLLPVIQVATTPPSASKVASRAFDDSYRGRIEVTKTGLWR
jgi:hypothetical protein